MDADHFYDGSLALDDQCVLEHIEPTNYSVLPEKRSGSTILLPTPMSPSKPRAPTRNKRRTRDDDTSTHPTTHPTTKIIQTKATKLLLSSSTMECSTDSTGIPSIHVVVKNHERAVPQSMASAVFRANSPSEEHHRGIMKDAMLFAILMKMKWNRTSNGGLPKEFRRFGTSEILEIAQGAQRRRNSYSPLPNTAPCLAKNGTLQAAWENIRLGGEHPYRIVSMRVARNTRRAFPHCYAPPAQAPNPFKRQQQQQHESTSTNTSSTGSTTAQNGEDAAQQEPTHTNTSETTSNAVSRDQQRRAMGAALTSLHRGEMKDRGAPPTASGARSTLLDETLPEEDIRWLLGEAGYGPGYVQVVAAQVNKAHFHKILALGRFPNPSLADVLSYTVPGSSC
jgi:hypothetical protein